MKKANGWKVLDSELKCRGFQFEVGKRYKHKGEIVMCQSGFHFHENRNDLFEYYDFDEKNRVCEVIARNKIKTGDNKSVTNDIEVIRELSWNEVLNLVNTGSGNSGWRNSGYGNSGYRNSGDRNSGLFNKTDYCSGVFNSKEQKVPLFNGSAHVLMSEFRNTRAYNVLCRNSFPLNEWIYEADMTEKEKKDNPKFYVAEGYLKTNSYEYACKKWWELLSNDEKKVIQNIDGFKKSVFKEVTGITIK